MKFSYLKTLMIHFQNMLASSNNHQHSSAKTFYEQIFTFHIKETLFRYKKNIQAQNSLRVIFLNSKSITDSGCKFCEERISKELGDTHMQKNNKYKELNILIKQIAGYTFSEQYFHFEYYAFIYKSSKNVYDSCIRLKYWY